MATDLLGSVLEREVRAITRGLKIEGCPSEYSIQKLAKILPKASSWKPVKDILVKPMEKQENQESVRRRIMEHEEIFRKQVHELHRLYQVQKSLMAEVGGKNHNFHPSTDETHDIAQDARPSLKNTASTSESAQHPAPQQVSEHWFLQQCSPPPCLSLFDGETSRTQERFDTKRPASDHKSVEGESRRTCAESDLDLKLSIGPSSHATKTTHWLFSGRKERNSPGQHL